MQTHSTTMTSDLISFFAQFEQSERTILILLADCILVISIYVFIYILRAVNLLVTDKRLGRMTIPFEASPKKPTHHFLIIGDSLAAGVGAKDAHNSIAGRLSRDYPSAHINNHGQNGSKVNDLVENVLQLEEQFFDLAIIQIGGNDILAYSTPKDIIRDLFFVLPKIKKMTNNNVILVGPLNVGSSSLFWFPFTLLYSARSKMMSDIFYKVCKTLSITYVDVYAKRYDDPFYLNRNLYFADDKIHPSDEGYSYIYNKIKQSLDTQNLVEV
jgi:lysophospholipase L1-like esterase